jgi:cytochrome c-type biogenesis protein CcmH
MRPALRAVFALCAWGLLCAAAADPADRLADPGQEARARALFRDVRCLVCQSESIDESEADLARDLRQLIRQQVSQGRSDEQIRAYLVSRYGEFVLLTPRLTLGNSLLWAGPAAVVVIGLAALALRRRTPSGSEDLSPEEEAAVGRLHGDEPL